MAYTIPTDLRHGIISDYISLGLVATLVNDPLLGAGTLTAQQLTYRLNYTTSILVSKEVGGFQLNGYARSIVNPLIVDNINNQSSYINLQSSFTSSSISMQPFTHIVYICQANLIDASPINGNNRGDSEGRVLLAEEVINTPLTISPNATFTHKIKLNLNALTI